VRAVGRGIAVLDGVHVIQREGEVLGFLFPIFKMGNVIGSPTVKCFRFVCKNLTFPFGKRIVGKIDSWAFWRYIQFQDQSWGCSTKTYLQRRLFIELYCAWPWLCVLA